MFIDVLRLHSVYLSFGAGFTRQSLLRQRRSLVYYYLIYKYSSVLKLSDIVWFYLFSLFPRQSLYPWITLHHNKHPINSPIVPLCCNIFYDAGFLLCFINRVVYLFEHLLTKSPFAPTLPWNPCRRKFKQIGHPSQAVMAQEEAFLLYTMSLFNQIPL